MADTKYLVDEEYKGIRYIVYENGGVHQWEAFIPTEAQKYIRGANGEMKSIEGCKHSAKNFIDRVEKTMKNHGKEMSHASLQITTANSQVFQSLYIDTDAKEDKDKIVLIEEMVDSLPEAQGILHSMLKEPYYGMVVAGSNIGVAKFRAKMYDLDHEKNLGKEDMAEILTQIAELAYSLNCEVVHFKGPIKYDDTPEKMKNISVALDLKSIFDPAKIKNAGKEFWQNLIGVDKELEKEYNKLDLKEHKKLMDYLEKNEGSIEKLNKAIKDKTIVAPNLENMLADMKIDDYEEYLGPTYSNLKYYYIGLRDFLNRQGSSKEEKAYMYDDKPESKPLDPNEPPPVPVEDPNMTQEEKEGKFPFDKPVVKKGDPRETLKSWLISVQNSHGKLMDKTNIVDIGINKDHLILALKRPEQYKETWWPKSPVKGTTQLLKSFDWLKNPKDNKKK